MVVLFVCDVILNALVFILYNNAILFFLFFSWRFIIIDIFKFNLRTFFRIEILLCQNQVLLLAETGFLALPYWSDFCVLFLFVIFLAQILLISMNMFYHYLVILLLMAMSMPVTVSHYDSVDQQNDHIPSKEQQEGKWKVLLVTLGIFKLVWV